MSLRSFYQSIRKTDRFFKWTKKKSNQAIKKKTHKYTKRKYLNSQTMQGKISRIVKGGGNLTFQTLVGKRKAVQVF